MIGQTGFSFHLISQYFSPENWKETGSNKFITRRRHSYTPSILQQRWDDLFISKHECSFYDNNLIDLSMFQYFYGGIDCSFYGIGSTEFSYTYMDLKETKV